MYILRDHHNPDFIGVFSTKSKLESYLEKYPNAGRYVQDAPIVIDELIDGNDSIVSYKIKMVDSVVTRVEAVEPTSNWIKYPEFIINARSRTEAINKALEWYKNNPPIKSLSVYVSIPTDMEIDDTIEEGDE